VNTLRITCFFLGNVILVNRTLNLKVLNCQQEMSFDFPTNYNKKAEIKDGRGTALRSHESNFEPAFFHQCGIVCQKVI
jgi:hypothetical protein